MGTMNLAGRVALVTGSTRGLGRSMAFALGRAGARVALNFQNDQSTADRAFSAYQEAGLDGMLVRGDITDPAEVERAIAEITAQLGPVDILVPNATCAQPMEPIEGYDWQAYQRMIDFFVKSPFLLTRACLPHMKRQRWGRIINICTTAFVAGKPIFSAYVAAKGGQVGMSRSLASELAPFGITVNMVSPGWIPVERHAGDPQEAKDAYRARIPIGRLGVPDDVGGAVVFFASEASSFVTGQNINVNGGVTIG
jgi:3-oxoacyl-[acyl-carrier protein] reductase